MILQYLITVLFFINTLRGVSGLQMLGLALPDLIKLGEASETARILGIVAPDEELFQRQPDLPYQVDRNEE